MVKLTRSIIGALVTIDVHARDIVTQMVKNQVYELMYYTCDFSGGYSCCSGKPLLSIQHMHYTHTHTHTHTLRFMVCRTLSG